MKILIYVREDKGDNLLGQLAVGPVPNLPQAGDVLYHNDVAYIVQHRVYDLSNGALLTPDEVSIIVTKY